MARSTTRKNRQRTFLVFSCVLLLGCILGGFIWLKPARKKLYAEDYKRTIQANEDLKMEKHLGAMHYHCEYIPAEYNAIKYLRPDIETSGLRDAVNASLGFLYFKVSVKSTDPENPVMDPTVLDAKEYNGRIQYFNAFAQNNFKVLYGKDTLKCTQYVFENPYNLVTDVRLMLAFRIPDPQPARDVQLVYNDELFNNGLVKFYFDRTDILQIPELIINP
jgi:hypothetical protein